MVKGRWRLVIIGGLKMNNLDEMYISNIKQHSTLTMINKMFEEMNEYYNELKEIFEYVYNDSPIPQELLEKFISESADIENVKLQLDMIFNIESEVKQVKPQKMSRQLNRNRKLVLE